MKSGAWRLMNWLHMTKNLVFEGGQFHGVLRCGCAVWIAVAEFDDAPGDDGAVSREMIGRRA